MKSAFPEYDPAKIESKWQKFWAKKKIYQSKEDDKKTKFYALDMFPYPSGEGLHVGHPKGYIATDIVSRFQRMNGKAVLHPMGFDAFGLPAENYAIKTKTNPADSVSNNVQRYKKQLEILGFDYDWSREVNTTDPKFYKWTQWAFLQMLKRGLAYESNEPVNWCPTDKTVLANEDVEDGRCERCGTPVEKKPMRQWVLKITDYADRLLADLDAENENKPFLDWPESIKEAQRNWIGRSEGVKLKFKVKDSDITFEMYDSIPQTFMAQTFTVIAPEHKAVHDLVMGTEYEKPVLDFVESIKQRKSKLGFDHMKDMEGIFTGRYIEYKPANRLLPIWVASYAVADYGSGVVNCSYHDERDYAFAKKYDIPLHPVLFPKDSDLAEKVKKHEIFYREPDGVLMEPAEFKGREWNEVREDVIDFIVEKGWGTKSVQYKLRDWVFSRQRYWGEPIPVIHCEKCGVVSVPEEDLPVKLPKVKFYEPTGTGESPLADIDEWVNVKCPNCKSKAKRETNTMPQWAGSSWYYLRYEDPKNNKSLVDSKKEKYWSPVDLYVGGAEHATRHLIYARFWHKFLYDIGVVSGIEPFKKLQSVGLIMGEDGRKMSKRFGNVVNPDEIVARFGADTLRLYEMFMGPFDQQIAWSTDSMVGSRRFIERVWRLFGKVSDTSPANDEKTLLHRTIKKVTEDIRSLRFNTAVSALMIAANEFEKYPSLSKEVYSQYLQLLAPFSPHFTEELWSNLGYKNSIHLSAWPEYDSALAMTVQKALVVQVNGKVRGEMPTQSDIEQIKKDVLEVENIKKWLVGKSVKKIIVVPDRLVNIVTD